MGRYSLKPLNVNSVLCPYKKTTTCYGGVLFIHRTAEKYGACGFSVRNKHSVFARILFFSNEFINDVYDEDKQSFVHSHLFDATDTEIYNKKNRKPSSTLTLCCLHIFKKDPRAIDLLIPGILSWAKEKGFRDVEVTSVYLEKNIFLKWHRSSSSFQWEPFGFNCIQSDGNAGTYHFDLTAKTDFNKKGLLKQLAFKDKREAARALESGDRVKEAIIRLTLAGERVYTPLIAGHIGDADVDLRKVVCASLGDLKAGDHANLVVERLIDDNLDIRMWAADALASIGDHNAVPPLLNAMNGPVASDYHYNVRAVAARTLGLIGDKTIIPKLQPFLEDRNYSVRYRVKQALELLSGKE